MIKFLLLASLIVSAPYVRSNDEQDLLSQLQSTEDLDYSADNELKYQKVDPDLFQTEFPTIDFELINQIRLIDLRTQDIFFKIKNRKRLRKYSIAEEEALKVKLEDIVKSGIFFGAIRRGTKFIHLKSGKVYYNQKLLTVRAYRKSDYEGYKVLVNKDGFSTHKVLSTGIDNIKSVVDLYEAPKKFKATKKKLNYKEFDEKIKYTAQFNLNTGITESKFLKNLSRNSSSLSQTFRYELQVYSSFNLPFSIGASLNLENTFRQLSQNGGYKINTLSLGPLIKSKEKQIGDGFYTLSGQFRHDIFSNATVQIEDESKSFNLTQTSFALGVERRLKSFLGELALGVNYQRQWFRASSEGSSSNTSKDSNTADSILISLGIRGKFL